MKKVPLLACVIAAVQGIIRPTIPLSFPNQSGPVRVAFGSCFNIFNYTSDIFKTIRAQRPDLWVWLGDAYYTDQVELAPFVDDTSLDEDYGLQRLKMTLADPDYQRLIEDGVQVIGIWDDHDFGNNNGGKEFARKGIYREMFLDFLGELGTPRRD